MKLLPKFLTWTKESVKMQQQVVFATENSDKLEGDKVYREALEVEKIIQQAVENAQQTVTEVSSLAFSLDAGTGEKTSKTLWRMVLFLAKNVQIITLKFMVLFLPHYHYISDSHPTVCIPTQFHNCIEYKFNKIKKYHWLRIIEYIL